MSDKKVNLQDLFDEQTTKPASTSYKKSAEHCALIGAANAKNEPYVRSDETRAKMSAIAKKRTYSEETRAKMSASASARKTRPPHSEESKAKMRESQKQRYNAAKS